MASGVTAAYVGAGIGVTAGIVGAAIGGAVTCVTGTPFRTAKPLDCGFGDGEWAGPALNTDR